MSLAFSRNRTGTCRLRITRHDPLPARIVARDRLATLESNCTLELTPEELDTLIRWAYSKRTLISLNDLCDSVRARRGRRKSANNFAFISGIPWLKQRLRWVKLRASTRLATAHRTESLPDRF
jgi:hypothetical protein